MSAGGAGIFHGHPSVMEEPGGDRAFTHALLGCISVCVGTQAPGGVHGGPCLQRCIQKPSLCMGLCLSGRRVLLASVFVRLSVCRPPELMAYPRILANPLANTWDATKAALEQLGSRGGVDITK